MNKGNKKKVAIVTGSRADYGSLHLIIKKIIKSECLDLLLYVTGMHLLESYGKTVNMIKEDKFPIQKEVPMYKEKMKEISGDLGKAIALAIKNFTRAFIEDKPDILLVTGDRFEIFCPVIAAATLNIAIAHIHGGDRVKYGQIDELIRHSVSKFAHIHFPGSKSSAERLIKMGEEEWRICQLGSPYIDQIFHISMLNKEQIFTKFSLNIDEKTALCVFHSFIPEADEAGKQMNIILESLKDLKLQTVILYPNNDLGNDKIIETINKYSHIKFFKIFKNLERIYYLSLLKNVDLIIGNSSSSCIDTPTLKTPSIITGPRNKDRETANNVIRVSIEKPKIIEAIKFVLSKEFKEKCQSVISPYGDGTASEKIVKKLEELKINKKLLNKIITY